MKKTQHTTTDVQPDESVQDGDFDAREVGVYVTDATNPVSVTHGLGRVPQRVEKVLSKGKAVDFYLAQTDDGEDRWDENYAHLVFSVAKVFVKLRFS